MDHIVNVVFSTPFLALTVSVIIFIVTLALVAKRLIGFFVTLLLLAFTIISGYAVFNNEIISKAIQQYVEGKGDQRAIEEFKMKVNHDIQELKDQFNTSNSKETPQNPSHDEKAHENK
jgi:hypothetical protein